MELLAAPALVEQIAPWRDLYGREMNCQIVHDSLHARPGWTTPYLLVAGGIQVGYGSAVVDGPWKGRPTVFEFYVLPQHRLHVFDLFGVLLRASGAVAIETQTNDTLLTVMLHSFAEGIAIERILFHDSITTAHPPPPAATFRRVTQDDAPRLTAQNLEPDAQWMLEIEGTPAATGGILFHYNRPYGDIYMRVAEPFRRHGLGTYIVQELKRVCYEGGSIPSARCRPENVASRSTLQKAGFVPCGSILAGAVRIGAAAG